MSKSEGEYKCPNCGNDILTYIVKRGNPNPPSSDWFNYKEGFKFRIFKNQLENYTKGKWVGFELHKTPPTQGMQDYHWFLCKCGFSSHPLSHCFLDYLKKEDSSFNTNKIEIKEYENGNKYIGQFVNGKREGYGIMYFANGGKYEGNWKKGLAEGKGIEYYQNGDRFEGGYHEDEEHGQGVYYFKNGDRIMGDYINGKKVGKHIKLSANGEVNIINYDN
jgi:hypothetical protein